MITRGDKMRISALPVATNYAKTSSSQLTQYQYTGVKTQTNLNNTGTSEARLTTSLVSSVNSYTKDDAILKQWNKIGGFNLYSVLDGKEKVNLQNPNPSTQELKAFETTLQQNGIQSDIDLSELSFDLRGIGFGTNNSSYQLSPDDFSRKTDYLASRYVSMYAKIQENSSGVVKREQLEKLNAIYQDTLEELATGYSNILDNFFEQNGVTGEKNKIYQAVIDGVNGKVAEYQEFLSINPDFSGLKNTQDEWMLQDDEYVASLLRNVELDLLPDIKNDSYTLQDLDVLGRYVAELSEWEKSSNAVNVMDEGRIGLDFAMLSMKTDTLSKKLGISSNLNTTLQKLMNGFMNGFLDRLDEQLSDLRNNGTALKDKVGYAALDRQSIWNVYNKTIEHYKTSGSAVDALVEGAKLSAQANNNNTYRQINSQLFWANFFENDTSTISPSYIPDETPCQKYVVGWIDFENSLNSDGVNLNMKLKPSSSYQLPELLNVKA